MTAPDFRTELKAKAEELGIEYFPNVKTEKLLEVVNEVLVERGEDQIIKPLTDEEAEEVVELATDDALAAAFAESETLTAAPKTKKPQQTPELKEAMLKRLKLINIRMQTKTVSADVRKNMRYELSLMKQGLWEPNTPYRDPRTSSALEQVFSD